MTLLRYSGVYRAYVDVFCSHKSDCIRKNIVARSFSLFTLKPKFPFNRAKLLRHLMKRQRVTVDILILREYFYS